MSKEKKKPKQNKQKANPTGQVTAAVEAESQPHNAKQAALGRNTRQG